MIISDANEFIFIHVPKCAGTSIRNALFQYDTRNNYYWMQHELPGARTADPILPIDKAHMPLAILKQLYPHEFGLLSEYTTFAVSRHPRARLVSAFFEPRKDLLEIAKADDHKSLEKVHGDFAQFITNLTAGANFLHPSFVHAAPQYLFHVYRGKVLTDAIIALEAPSEGISRLKCLNPVAGFAAEKALLEKKNAKNVSEKLRLWDALSEGLQRKCEILYKNDCELLGYDFNS